MSKYMKIQAIVREYSICRSVVYELIAERKIRAVKLGRSTIIERASVDEYFAIARLEEREMKLRRLYGDAIRLAAERYSRECERRATVH